MCTNELKSTKAITLIALVISILVLLILAGVSVGLLVGENGITGRAVTAKKTYDIAGAKEQVELLVAGYKGDYYGKKYTSGEAVSQDIGTYVATQLASDTTVGEYTLETSGENVTLKKGGETVAKGKINSSGGLEWSNSLVATWEQDGTSVTNGDVTLTVGQAVTGYEVEGYESLNWFVLGAEDGKILITTNTNPEILTLSGKEGYTGGVATLNSATAKYSDGDLADSVRSINVEDINKVTGYDPDVARYNSGTENVEQWENNVTYTLENGKIYYKGTKYPQYVENEIGTESEETSFEYWDGSNWIELGEGTNHFSSTIKNTFYFYYPNTLSTSPSGENNGITDDSDAYSLLFDNTKPWRGNQSYWLGSAYVKCGDGYVIYGMHYVINGLVYNGDVSFRGTRSFSYGLRPVVSLKPSVNVTSAGVVSK